MPIPKMSNTSTLPSMEQAIFRSASFLQETVHENVQRLRNQSATGNCTSCTRLAASFTSGEGNAVLHNGFLTKSDVWPQSRRPPRKYSKTLQRSRLPNVTTLLLQSSSLRPSSPARRRSHCARSLSAPAFVPRVRFRSGVEAASRASSASPASGKPP